tara:strand:- start:149 stop:304 length:156 start_codon:yes stop_codon:yes gene_type:complete
MAPGATNLAAGLQAQISFISGLCVVWRDKNFHSIVMSFLNDNHISLLRIPA